MSEEGSKNNTKKKHSKSMRRRMELAVRKNARDVSE